ncbi:21445_t:CDS:2, partial [Rhizophagus irregularis]
LINSYWYSKEGLMLIDKRQEFPIKLIEDKVIPISEFYGYGLELCKKALNLAITNGSNKVFEKLLQDFIKQQLSV